MISSCALDNLIVFTNGKYYPEIRSKFLRALKSAIKAQHWMQDTHGKLQFRIDAECCDETIVFTCSARPEH